MIGCSLPGANGTECPPAVDHVPAEHPAERPLDIRFVTEIPRDPTGKLDRKALRAALASGG